MRAPWSTLALLVAVTAPAYAQNTRVLVMTDPADLAALRVTMRGVDLAPLAPPEGALRLDRAAVVQRAALDAGADAGVWLEQDAGVAEVCVVSADGKLLRHAPLPPDRSPRVFAAIAASLLDEILAPPEAGMPSIGIDLHIDVNPPPPSAAIAPVPLAAPGMMQIETPLEIPRANRTLVEIGPMISPLTFGLEAEIAFPISSRFRFGALAIANALPFDNFAPLFGGGLEIRRVGLGRRHFDLGVIGGAATAEGDSVGFTALRLEIVWEGATSGLGLSVAPTLFFTGTSDPVLPGIWTSLRWELPV